MPIKHSSHARYDIWYHFAWSTKYRKRVFTHPITRQRIETIFRSIASHYDIQVGQLKCLSGHIYLTASAPPRLAPARIVQILKSVSTKQLFKEFPWLRQFYWGGEIWIGGYFVRTVGSGQTKEQIDQYIQEQAEES